MASSIRVVAEQEMAPGSEPGQWEPAEPPRAETSPAAVSDASPSIVSRETEIVAAIGLLNGRLQAVEGVIAGVPKAMGAVRALAAALGNRALMLLALAGCLGLAAATVLWPSPVGIAIFGCFAVLVYLPLAYISSRGA